MDDELAKAHLQDRLHWALDALVGKLDGLSEYDVRRPVTTTGTNLLGLVKHTAISNSRYFGLVFSRPFPEPLPQWDDYAVWNDAFWVTERETRSDVLDLYRRVREHSDNTIEALELDTRGYVPWWQEEVPLFNVLVHCLSEANRHAGHADIVRETLDGAVGDARNAPMHGRDRAFWDEHNQRIARAAAKARRSA